MELIISLIMGTRLLSLFSGGQESTVTFFPPRIIVTSTEVRLNCLLVNPFPEELRKLIGTATPVYLYLFIELHEIKKRPPVRKITVETTIAYDMIGKQFWTVRNAVRDTTFFTTLDSALSAASTFNNVLITTKNSIDKDAEYTVVVSALLGKSRVEALNNRTIDCMYYWDFKRPSVKTEKIKGRVLFGAHGRERP